MKVDKDLQRTLSWSAVCKTSRGNRIGFGNEQTKKGQFVIKRKMLGGRQRVRVSPWTTTGDLQALLGKL